MTLRQACSQSSKAVPTHALVQFMEDSAVSIVPVKMICEEFYSLKPGDTCTVKWNSDSTYKAEVLAIGSKSEMNRKELAAVGCEDDAHQPKAKKRKKTITKQSKKQRKQTKKTNKEAPPPKKAKTSEFEIKTVGPLPPRSTTTTQPTSTSISITQPSSVTASATSNCVTQPSSSSATTPISVTQPINSISLTESPLSSSSSSDSLSTLSDLEFLSTPTNKVITVGKEREIFSPVHMIQQGICSCKEDFTLLKEDLTLLKEDVTLLKEGISEIKEEIRVVKTVLIQVKDDCVRTQETPLDTPTRDPPRQPTSTRISPKQSTPSTDEFSTSFLVEEKAKSSSRQNFAARLVRQLYTANERKSSNVKGVLGKKKLSPKRLDRVKDATLQMWPCEAGETNTQAWSTCRKAIDESCRRLNRTNIGKAEPH